MRTMGLLLGGVLLAGAASTAHAQGATGDSLIARAGRLAGNGNAAAARALADSALGVAKEGSSAYADALFARASVAESTDAARKDYQRIVVDYSMSPRAQYALLRLAQMELARGDRTSARDYLRRLALEHPDGPASAEGAYWLARIMLQEGAVLPACASLADARQRVAPENVELANQINYYALPCAAAQHAADSAHADSVEKVMRADSVARADSIVKANAAIKKKAKATPAKAARGKPAGEKSVPSAASSAAKSGWSAQVAAYDARDEADRLAKRLKDRGYDTRVSADRPFRVRIGWSPRRDDATALVAKLKEAKIDAFVVAAEKP